MKTQSTPLKSYNKLNFHKHTFCIFTQVENSYILNLEPNFTSKSGSVYFFTVTGVYRLSNHWSRVANCKWRLINSNQVNDNGNRTKLGYANWTDFHQDNEFEKIYYLEVDFIKNEVHFQHKNNCKLYKTLFRSASETTKLIKQVRNLLETESWAKHLNQDIKILRKEIIESLLNTNESLQIIKKQYL